MKIKRTGRAVALALISMISARATTVDFTSAEGSADGPLNYDLAWNGSSAFLVDSEAGTLAMQSMINNSRIYNTENLGIHSNYTVAIRFSFNRAVADISNQNVLGILLSDLADEGGERFEMIVQRTGGGGTGGYYRLRCNHQDSEFTTLGLGGTVHETVLGFGSGDDLSDDLWLGMTLSRGADAESWVVSGVLSNMTTGVQVDAYSSTCHTGSYFIGGTVYGGMTGCSLESFTQTANRTVDLFDVSVSDSKTEIPPDENSE